MSTFNIPPSPKYKTGYSNSRTHHHITNDNYIQSLKTKSNLTNIENLLLTIDSSPIKNVINEDLQKAIQAQLSWRGPKIQPQEQNYNGVKFFMFNEPSPEYREDFERLLNQYQEYFTNSKNDVILRTKNNKYLSSSELSSIDYQRRRIRDFNQQLPVTDNNKIIEILENRIKGFNTCHNQLKQENFPNINIESLTKIKNFLKKQKKIEENVVKQYNEEINMLQENNRVNNKAQKINILKKNKLKKLSRSILFGPNNQIYNENTQKCVIPFTGTKLENFNYIVQKYILPQKNKIMLLGIIQYLLDFKDCTSLFHSAPNFEISPELTNKNMCHKYIHYSPYLNYFYFIISYKKNIDLPMAIYMPQNEQIKYFPKKRRALKQASIKDKFLGVIDIPYYFQKININTLETKYILTHKYIFIFENLKGKYYRDFYDSYSTPFLLMNKDLYRIFNGFTNPVNTIFYDEIGYLDWLSKDIKTRPYYYYDTRFPDFIFISQNDNLDNKELYHGYDLKKIYLEEWKQNGKKQYIFRSSNINLPFSQNKSLNIKSINKNKYFLASVEKVDQNFQIIN
jgi:hypothetical protein